MGIITKITQVHMEWSPYFGLSELQTSRLSRPRCTVPNACLYKPVQITSYGDLSIPESRQAPQSYRSQLCSLDDTMWVLI